MHSYVNAIIGLALAASAVQDVRQRKWLWATCTAAFAALNGWAATM